MKSIIILGTKNCGNCTKCKNKIKKIIDKNNLEVEVKEVHDIAKILEYQIMTCPAVIIDDEIKCVGRTPKEKELINWLSS